MVKNKKKTTRNTKDKIKDTQIIVYNIYIIIDVYFNILQQIWEVEALKLFITVTKLRNFEDFYEILKHNSVFLKSMVVKASYSCIDKDL